MDIVLNFYNIDAMTLNKAVILETTKVNTINSAIILFLFGFQDERNGNVVYIGSCGTGDDKPAGLFQSVIGVIILQYS